MPAPNPNIPTIVSGLEVSGRPGGSVIPIAHNLEGKVDTGYATAATGFDIPPQRAKTIVETHRPGTGPDVLDEVGADPSGFDAPEIGHAALHDAAVDNPEGFGTGADPNVVTAPNPQAAEMHELLARARADLDAVRADIDAAQHQ